MVITPLTMYDLNIATVHNYNLHPRTGVNDCVLVLKYHSQEITTPN